MLAVDKENGLYGVLYLEFLPRVMQRVEFCLCESNGGFSTKLTKYIFIVHALVIRR